MKALVVEDDPTARRLLRGLLEKKFGYDVAEAVDGVDALEQVHREQPDVILLDIQMPRLDGIDVLRGLRGTDQFADIPVIAVSSVSEREAILEMIGLGICDYILKPMSAGSAQTRLGDVLSRIVPKKARVAASESEHASSEDLLVVDNDVNFCSFVTMLLDGEYQIQTVDEPFAALDIIEKRLASVVLVGDDLDLLQAPSFARVVREAPDGADIQLIFVSAGTELSEADAAHFDSVIRKSFVPETFSADLHRALAAGNGGTDLETLLQGELRRELITAAQQTIGVLTNQEAEPLTTEDELVEDLRCEVKLSYPGGPTAAVLRLGGTKDDVLSLARRILGEDVGLEDGATDAFAEVANTIAGRLRQSLADRGMTLEPQTPETLSQPFESDPLRGMVVPFEMASGERFVLEVGVGD